MTQFEKILSADEVLGYIKCYKEWNGYFPTKGTLKMIFKVSARTISRRLDELRKEGKIVLKRKGINWIIIAIV